MSKIRAVKGMNDLLPEDLAAWHHVEGIVRDWMGRYGYQELRTPAVEETRLFARSIGESTDIVGKEMYTFPDRSDRSLSLRPEGTAGAVRAYIQHSVHQREPVTRWWYAGPMYRYERVQAGRYRQFHQIGCEVFGSPEAATDAEMLVMLNSFLTEGLGVQDVTLYLNSLGDPEERPAYHEALRGYLEGHLEALCENCQRRFETNPLRTLDCKVPTCQPILDAAPAIGDHISEDARAHYAEVKHLLDLMEVPYVEKARLVRGLDYYNRTCFEFTSGALGAQDAVCGGGRYDGLVKRLGGPKTPAIGFAMGVERLVSLLPESGRGAAPRPDASLIALGDEAFEVCFRLVEQLRARGLAVDLDPRRGSVKSQMRRADKLDSRYAVVVGESELASGKVELKDMRSDAPSSEVSLDALAEAIQSGQET